MEMISARYLQVPTGMPNDESTATSREAVAAQFLVCVRGVSGTVAQERTKRFYRSSGQAWTFALA